MNNQKQNYQKILEKIIEENEKKGIVPSLMLHSCCAPCSTSVIEYLSKYFFITIDYYNPNIYPQEEFWERAKTQEKLLSSMNTIHPVKLIIPEPDFKAYDRIHHARQNQGEGEEACFACYHFRMLQVAKLAKEENMDYFSTTLSVSPHKNSMKINELGEKIANQVGIKWLYSDFKKKNGYKRSIELSKEFELYRQDYCGCETSLKESIEREKLKKSQILLEMGYNGLNRIDFKNFE